MSLVKVNFIQKVWNVFVIGLFPTKKSKWYLLVSTVLRNWWMVFNNSGDFYYCYMQARPLNMIFRVYSAMWAILYRWIFYPINFLAFAISPDTPSLVLFDLELVDCFAARWPYHRITGSVTSKTHKLYFYGG